MLLVEVICIESCVTAGWDDGDDGPPTGEAGGKPQVKVEVTEGEEAL